jgi:hypothetical protein
MSYGTTITFTSPFRNIRHNRNVFALRDFSGYAAVANPGVEARRAEMQYY